MNMSTIDFILTCMIYKISRTIWWNWRSIFEEKDAAIFAKLGNQIISGGKDWFPHLVLTPYLRKKKHHKQTPTSIKQIHLISIIAPAPRSLSRVSSHLRTLEHTLARQRWGAEASSYPLPVAFLGISQLILLLWRKLLCSIFMSLMAERWCLSLVGPCQSSTPIPSWTLLWTVGPKGASLMSPTCAASVSKAVTPCPF